MAVAWAPMALGISAQALSVRLENDYLRVTAPQLEFLTGKPLDRLHDGRNVNYLGQLTVSTGADRIVQGRSVVRFAFSYDIWTSRFKVTVMTPGLKTPGPSAKNLTAEAAQAWCLDQMKIDLSHVPVDRPVYIRIEMRSEDPKDTEGIVGDKGINLSGLIAVFSHPVRDKQVIHVAEEIGPLRVTDLRKPRI
jgi:hypothetical protein